MTTCKLHCVGVVRSTEYCHNYSLDQTNHQATTKYTGEKTYSTVNISLLPSKNFTKTRLEWCCDSPKIQKRNPLPTFLNFSEVRTCEQFEQARVPQNLGSKIRRSSEESSQEANGTKILYTQRTR